MAGADKNGGLQVARACAALGIAYFHSWRPFIGFPPNSAHPILLLRDHGWIAVDFFFAISGFVICLATTSPRFDRVSFIIRRAFRLYPLWIGTSLIYLYLTRYIGRDARQTAEFFAYSLTLLPTDGMPFYDLGWSLQHEMAFYVLAMLIVPRFGLVGLAGVLMAGIVIDHAVALPWYLHQFFSYYGNFLAGVAAFAAVRHVNRLGTLLPIALGFVALYFAPSRAFYPIGLFCWMLGFLNMKRVPTAGILLGDASYSIYLIHPLVFLTIYINMPNPLPPIWVQEPIRYAALTAVCLLASASWLWFEKSMNRLGQQLAWRISALPA